MLNLWYILRYCQWGSHTTPRSVVEDKRLFSHAPQHWAFSVHYLGQGFLNYIKESCASAEPYLSQCGLFQKSTEAPSASLILLTLSLCQPIAFSIRYILILLLFFFFYLCGTCVLRSGGKLSSKKRKKQNKQNKTNYSHLNKFWRSQRTSEKG